VQLDSQGPAQLVPHPAQAGDVAVDPREAGADPDRLVAFGRVALDREHDLVQPGLDHGPCDPGGHRGAVGHDGDLQPAANTVLDGLRELLVQEGFAEVLQAHRTHAHLRALVEHLAGPLDGHVPGGHAQLVVVAHDATQVAAVGQLDIDAARGIGPAVRR
jgi:hypothetical protein